MDNATSIERAEFIDNLQRWFNESTNMCHEDCYSLAFIIWQHKDYLSKTLGYEKGVEDERQNVNESVGRCIERHKAEIRADEREKVLEELNEIISTKTNPMYWIEQMVRGQK